MSRQEVIVVGAGLAGLCCALELQRAGVACSVVDGSDGVGGRVRTDRHESFLLDRGFQVLLTAYPECRRLLDYEALEFRRFLPGSVIRHGGRFHRLTDPWRRPSRALETLFSPIGTFGDKLRVASLNRRVGRAGVEQLLGATETSTLARLRESGFSEAILERFFRPFLGGVFLDRELRSSSRMFEFLFKMFAEDDVVVPASGMQAIPESIAARLIDGSIRLGAEVGRVDPTGCTLTSGESLRARQVVLATDGSTANRLLAGVEPPSWRGTTCLYFDAAEPPWEEPALLLNGEGGGLANSVCVMSQVAPRYAPDDRSLVSVSVIEETDADLETIERAVRTQLRDWFGAAVDDWRALRHYRIPRALPSTVAARVPTSVDVEGVIVCGDHLGNPSIHGAMVSGRKAAEAVVARL